MLLEKLNKLRNVLKFHEGMENTGRASITRDRINAIEQELLMTSNEIVCKLLKGNATDGEIHELATNMESSQFIKDTVNIVLFHNNKREI